MFGISNRIALYIEVLSLLGNDFTGTIPTELGNISTLRKFCCFLIFNLALLMAHVAIWLSSANRGFVPAFKLLPR
jgi:hypothetical protein